MSSSVRFSAPGDSVQVSVSVVRGRDYLSGNCRAYSTTSCSDERAGKRILEPKPGHMSLVPLRRLVTTVNTVAVGCIVLTAGASAQSIDEATMPGRLVDVGDYRLHIDCRGSGDIPVVIDAGAGAWSIFFTHVQHSLIDRGARVCTYDRAGLGWSEPAPGPRTSSQMADDLHRLLQAAGEPSPYVLVGHSLGGLNVRLFAARHPQEVAGVVLAEAAHERQWEHLPEAAWVAVEAAMKNVAGAAEAARAGAIPAASIDAAGFARYAPQLRDTYVEAMTTPEPYEGFLQELLGVQDSHRQVSDLEEQLGSVPLAVVSAGNSFAAFEGSGIPVEESNRIWAELQEELTTLSSNSRQFVSDTARHGLQFSDPGILVEAVDWVLGQVDQGTRSSGVNDREFRVLPHRSTPAIDGLLGKLERAYEDMDVDGFTALFGDEFVQLDVNRGVRVEGIDAWREQTRRITAVHTSMSRDHFGRIWSAPWLIVEIEWSGTVRGEAIGAPGETRDYRYSGIGLLAIEDGRIQRQVLWGDFATLLKQLGPGVARE